MTQRAFAWLLGFSLLLLLAGSRPKITAAGEDQAVAEADLGKLLDGFAPLAQRGEWTRHEVKERPESAFDGIPKELQRGLQEILGLNFLTPDNESKGMTFFAARFETSAQAAAFLTAYHDELLRQLKRQASSPVASVWQQNVSKGAGKNGTLDGYAIDFVMEAFGTPFSFALQHFHVNRLFVSLMFANCSHVSRDVQDAFIAYALNRVTDPSLKPPPAPDLQVPTHEVTVLLRDPAGESVAMADAVLRSVSSGGAGPAVHLLNRAKMTLPAEPTKLRVGNAAGQDGRPLQLRAAEIIVASQESEVTVILPRGEPCQVRLLGPQGEPVSGAEVRTLSRQRRQRPQIRVHVMGDVLPQEETFPPVGDGKGTTDAEGVVLLPVDPKNGSKVVVDAGENFFPVVEDAPPGTKSRTIQLQPAWALHLVVQDCDGTPIAGDVEVRMQGKERYFETDADGRAEIGPLPRKAVHVRAQSDLADEESWIEVKPVRDPVVLTLTSHALQFRVLDTAGAPVPKYWVEISADRFGFGRTAEGATTLLLPAEPCSVEVREAADADGVPLNLAAVRATVSPEARELTLRMLPGLKMAGTVRTAGGRPVGGAQVWAGHNHDVHARTKTDDEGRYELVGLEQAVFTVHVRPPDGFAPPQPRDVRPTSDGPSVDFTLPRVVPITIVDWRGRPVRGAWVRVKVVGSGPKSGRYPIEDHTDKNGIAYLANLYPDQELHVMPQNSKDLASLHRPWDGSPVTLELERAHTVQVRVVDRLGPVAGATVDVDGGADLSRATGPEGRTEVILPYRPVRLRAQRTPSSPWSEWVQVKPRDLEVDVRVPDARR